MKRLQVLLEAGLLSTFAFLFVIVPQYTTVILQALLYVQIIFAYYQYRVNDLYVSGSCEREFSFTFLIVISAATPIISGVITVVHFNSDFLAMVSKVPTLLAFNVVIALWNLFLYKCKEKLPEEKPCKRIEAGYPW